jgi:hypothetical protein
MFDAVKVYNPDWEGVTVDEEAEFLKTRLENTFDTEELQEMFGAWAGELIKVCTREELLTLVKRYIDKNNDSEFVHQNYMNEIEMLQE